jgi:RNA polymerase sigma-70 factor (ECF subfamily)
MEVGPAKLQGPGPPYTWVEASMTFGREGPLSTELERALMVQLVAGDEDAIRAIYARFGRAVYAMGYRMLGSAEAAEELTQDVFLAAWRKGSRFDPARGRLSTWLMAIAHNMAIDRLRHDRGVARPTLVLVDQVPEPAAMDEETPLIERDAARRAMAHLSPADRQLLSKAYFFGWTAREIAEAEGIPLGTVKTRLRTALIKLRTANAQHPPASASIPERSGR